MSWQKCYEIARVYKKTFGNIDNIPEGFITKTGKTLNQKGIDLHKWVEEQRKDYEDTLNGKSTVLTPLKIEKLHKLGISLKSVDEHWLEMLNLATIYFKNHDKNFIPYYFKTINGINEISQGKDLGFWYNTNRYLASKEENTSGLSSEHITLINSIKKASLNDTIWNKNYKLAKKYFDENKNCFIHTTYRTTDDSNKKNYDLGSWFKVQLSKYKSSIENGTEELTKEQIRLLEDIGVNLELATVGVSWYEKYQAALNWKRNYDCKIPINFYTKDGVTKDPEGFDLYSWYRNQIKVYNSKDKKDLDPFKQKLLEKVITTNSISPSWINSYNLVKKYLEYYNTNIYPKSFKTIDGIHKDPNGKDLGYWYACARSDAELFLKTGKNRRGATKERVELLKQLGPISYNDYNWFVRYNLVKANYEHYGYITITRPYKTKDGIHTSDDDNAIDLGSWLYHQTYKILDGELEEEKAKLLIDVGIVLYPKRNKIDVKNICYDLEIRDENIIEILSRIPVDELRAKINFLKENNMNIIVDGKVHPIFTTSRTNLILEYNINYTELLDTYTYANNKNK